MINDLPYVTFKKHVEGHQTNENLFKPIYHPI